jgi:D-alanyl-D-alanine carboxypeptidase/D-alanyl-D-alanine-endopeptidase (penicillin-binding protein 4)
VRSAAIVAALLLASCSGAARPRVAPARPAAATAPDAVAALGAHITEQLAAPALERSTWGIVVTSLRNNQTLYALNPGRLLLPASNMKMVTLAAAAERLGWDFTYQTEVLAVGAIDFGYLDGDLLVVGTGDPTIDDWDGAATYLFKTWAERLKNVGIRVVGGRIIGDDNTFDDEAFGAGWAWDDLSASYSAGAGALQFNQNSAQMSVAPGGAAGAPAAVTLLPASSGLRLHNHLTTGAEGTPLTMTLRRLPGADVIELRGTVPLDQKPFSRNVSVDNPTRYFVSRLREALVDAGIEVRGEAVDVDDLPSPPSRAEGVRVLVHRSPPLSSIADTMMKLSQNLFAETMLRSVGGPASHDTIEAGRAAVRGVLDSWGIDTRQIVIADGSGLSRYNLATPAALVALLERVWRDERLRGPFEASLPVAGREGTLASRMKGTPAEGNARAKSGSFSNTRAISGYVATADGEPLAFSILTNNYGGPAEDVESAQDRIIGSLAAFSRR